MMKKLSILLLLLSFSAFSLFSQDSEADGMDDFDSIFESAQDLEEPVVEEKKETETASKSAASVFSSMVHITGKFNGEIGAAYVHMRDEEEGDDDFSGFFSLKNTLNMTVKPVNSFAIRGGLYTGIDNGFKVSVPYFYFDYLLLNHVYISAGKKSISWGNVRLFTSDYYGCEKHTKCLYSTGPRYANIFSEDDVPLAVDIKYPWSWGTLTFAVTGGTDSSIKLDNFNYYGSLEFSLLNTNLNIFAKRPAKNTQPERNEIYGLEIKRTILGFDTYAQGLARIKDYNSLNNPDGYEYVTGTAGLYRLFDSFEPNIGFNIEYQYEFNPATEEEHFHRLAFEGGVKRIGKKKNVKFGVLSHYNITEKHGYSGLNLIISKLLPYADWSNKVAVGYGSKYEIPAVIVSSSITLALDY